MSFESFIFKNGKIKIYALIISFVFWVIILGQKDIVVTKEVPVEYLLTPGFKVQDATDKVLLTISGKRSYLRKFDPEQSAPIIDLRSYSIGPKRLPVDKTSLNLPIGVKILSFEPKLVSVYIVGGTRSDKTY